MFEDTGCPDIPLYRDPVYTYTHAHLYTDILGMYTSNISMYIHTGDPQICTHRVGAKSS